MSIFSNIHSSIALPLIFMNALLTGCGGSSNSSSSNHQHDHSEHDHDEHSAALLVSHTNQTSLFVVEDGEIESTLIESAGVGSSLVRSDDGQFVAHIANNSIGFAYSDGSSDPIPLNYTLTGQSVIATAGHFSILNAGTSHLLPLSDLQALMNQQTTPTLETFDSHIQSAPLMLIDEGEELTLQFNGSHAQVYQEDVATMNSTACPQVSSLAQANEFAVFHCDTGNFTVQLQESELADDNHSATINAVDGSVANHWVAYDEIAVGFTEGGTQSRATILMHDDASDALITKHISTPSNQPICAAEIEPEHLSIILLTDRGEIFISTDHGDQFSSLALDEPVDCAQVNISTAADTIAIYNHAIKKLYEVDAHETSFHIHARHTFSSHTLADMTLMQARETHHEHDH